LKGRGLSGRRLRTRPRGLAPGRAFGAGWRPRLPGSGTGFGMDQASVAVLDVGKSNVKLSACTAEGHVVETLALPNPVLPGPPWRHHDLAALNRFVLDGLADLARRHPLTDFVASGHGSGGLLVAEDPDQDGTGLVLPMVDYEQPLPPGLAERLCAAGGRVLRPRQRGDDGGHPHRAADVLGRDGRARGLRPRALVPGHPAIRGLAAERRRGLRGQHPGRAVASVERARQAAGRRSWRRAAGAG
jgi:hypothetical protein